MQLPRYTFTINENILDYEFNSVGPKGNIKKIVRFTKIRSKAFNLAFGDLNEATGEISDTSITNNGDSRKVLATVAATVHDFLIQYPDSLIIARGSTQSRTRLYRIGITNHWSIIQEEFEIFGLRDNSWEIFEVHRNYDAFLIRRR